MSYREEIEAALAKDNTKYGKVWRGEIEDSRISKRLDVILERKAVETTSKEKQRWIERLDSWARTRGLSRATREKMTRRAERYIVVRQAIQAHNLFIPK